MAAAGGEGCTCTTTGSTTKAEEEEEEAVAALPPRLREPAPSSTDEATGAAEEAAVTSSSKPAPAPVTPLFWMSRWEIRWHMTRAPEDESDATFMERVRRELETRGCVEVGDDPVRRNAGAIARLEQAKQDVLDLLIVHNSDSDTDESDTAVGDEFF